MLLFRIPMYTIRLPWQEEKEGRVVEQEYLPKNLKGKKYYRPQ